MTKPKSEPTAIFDVIRAEANDYAEQMRAAQGDAANAQQALNNANQRYLLADGAYQACLALLKKEKKPDEVPPAPTP